MACMSLHKLDYRKKPEKPGLLPVNTKYLGHYRSVKKWMSITQQYPPKRIILFNIK